MEVNLQTFPKDSRDSGDRSIIHGLTRDAGRSTFPGVRISRVKVQSRICLWEVAPTKRKDE